VRLLVLFTKKEKMLLSAWASCETGSAVDIHNNKSDVIIEHGIWGHNFETTVGRKMLHFADDLYNIWSHLLHRRCLFGNFKNNQKHNTLCFGDKTGSLHQTEKKVNLFY
jgi:hypothetical protein